MARKRKKPVKWRLEYAGYRLMETVLKPLPVELVSCLGSGIGLLACGVSKHYRDLVLRNLRVAYGREKSIAELKPLVRQTFRHNFANFLGALKTTVMETSEISSHVHSDADRILEFLTVAKARGTGAILVLGHMGNWEILNRLHRHLPEGMKAGGIYQPLKNPYIDRLFRRRREQDGSVLFSKRDGFHAPASFVKNGGLLIIVADQRVARAGIPIPFFNRLSSLSPLPSILARKAGNCPIFASGIGTIAPGTWHLSFEEVPENRPDAIIATLESLVREFPADYLWLHNRWRLNAKKPLSLGARKESDVALPPTEPFRFLIPTRGKSEESALADFISSLPPHTLPLALHPLVYDDGDTPEAIAGRIRRLDESLPSPLVGALIDQPDPLIRRAVKLSTIPHSISNTEKLPLPEFLASLVS